MTQVFPLLKKFSKPPLLDMDVVQTLSNVKQKLGIRSFFSWTFLGERKFSPKFVWPKFFKWESAKVSHKRVFALLTPEIRSSKMAQMLQKPVFALPGCQRMSVNTLLCDTLGLAD